MFHRLGAVTENLIGIDMNKECVSIAHNSGYKNIVVGDAETYLFEKKFDVITAGEVIEHLLSPGLFLSNIKKNLKKDGKLILSTPNIFGITNTYKSLLGLEPKIYKEHTVGFNIQMLSYTLERSGYEIIDCYYTNEKASGIKNLIIRILSTLIKIYSQNIVIVAKLKS